MKWTTLTYAPATAAMRVPNGLLFKHQIAGGTEDNPVDTCSLAFVPCDAQDAIEYLRQNGKG